MERSKIDFARIKRDVLVVDVARRYGVDLRGRGTWLSGKCPLPSHESKDSKSSFAVNIEHNFWKCWSESCCRNRNGKKGGDVITLVARKENCGEYEAAQKLIEWFHLNGSSPAPPLTPEPIGMVLPPENKPLGFPGFKEVDKNHPYLKERGVNIATAEEFGVGYYGGKSTVIKDPYRIVIPIHNGKGELVAYAGRSLDPQEPNKYHFPPGFHKSLELFNLHRVTDEVEVLVIVEGFFGCMALHADGVDVIALMGCTMSEEQELLLKSRFSELPDIAIVLDGDKAGRENAMIIAGRLARWAFVTIVELPEGKQPDSLTTEEKLNFLDPVLG